METKTADSLHDNNPFSIGLRGLSLLFKRARSVAIFAIVISALALFTQIADTTMRISSGTYFQTNLQKQQNEEKQLKMLKNKIRSLNGALIVAFGIVFATLLFIMIIINLLIHGIFDHTAGVISKQLDTTLLTSLSEVWNRLPSYLWLNIIIVFKIVLWSLLLIVPGFVMAIRYSLAGTVFFRENIQGTAAIQRSLELTKGAWFTTFAAHALWNILTLGMIQAVLSPGTNAALYQHLNKTSQSNKRPAVHWLSWLTFFIPLALLLVLLVLGIIAIIVVKT